MVSHFVCTHGQGTHGLLVLEREDGSCLGLSPLSQSCREDSGPVWTSLKRSLHMDRTMVVTLVKAMMSPLHEPRDERMP